MTRILDGEVAQKFRFASDGPRGKLRFKISPSAVKDRRYS